jgi:hypothetical protein
MVEEAAERLFVHPNMLRYRLWALRGADGREPARPGRGLRGLAGARAGAAPSIPAVAEAAVIGIAHPALGEEVAAAVALKPDADLTTDELATSSSAGSPPISTRASRGWPPSSPRGPTGKVLRREIAVPTLNDS